MTRAALYARYSSDNQSEASIEDQFRLCREHAGRERWQIVGSYEDAAISGSSTILRSGIQRLVRDAQRGEFKILLAEALDRISRDQADVATLYKHLKFAGVTIVTLAEGEISELHVGLKGTMNALFLKDLAMKTHRGLRGRVEKGKAGGGLCYGYKVVKKFDANGEPIRGDREIIPEEADIIRRIFCEFASGKSPKAIAVDLNRDGIPGPLGRAWGDTSIRGHQTRGTGIINNELYTGVLVWNRLRYIKDPSTGRRVSRINPESQWIRTEVPHLRIVDDALWNATRARQKQISEIFGPNPANTLEGRMKRVRLTGRPVHLLSGLLTCGCCGGKVGIITPNRYACLNHHRRGTCDNGRSITRDRIEARVLIGLKERLVSSEAVAEAVRAYAEEMNRLNRDRHVQATTDQRVLSKVEKAIAGIIAAIEDGMYQPSMKARMEELERQKAEIAARMAKAPADVPDVHPNIANLYRLRIERLTEALSDPDGGRQAAEALRSLIGEIVLTPGKKRGEVHAELRGELFGILDSIKAEESSRPAGFMSTANAGPRNQPSPFNARYAKAPSVGLSAFWSPDASAPLISSSSIANIAAGSAHISGTAS
ncbi:MAG TPA: recombinase family protein [Rhizobium sp.]